MVRKVSHGSPGRSSLTMVLSLVYVSGNEQSKNGMLQPGQLCSLDVFQSVVTGCVYGILCVRRLYI